MAFLKTIIIVNLLVFISQFVILYLVSQRYLISYFNGALTFDPKVDRTRIFFHLTFIFITIVFFTNLYNLKTPYSYFDNASIIFSTIFNLGILFVMWWAYKNENKLFSYNFDLDKDIEESNILIQESNINNKNLLMESGFMKLVNPSCVEELIGLLLKKKIIDSTGKWISKEIKRKRDVSVIVSKLYANSLIRETNRRIIWMEARKFFNVDIDYSEMSNLISSYMDGDIEKRDFKCYRYIEFIDSIKLY